MSRSVLVVGASSGIGRAVAQHAMALGADVCVAARREASLIDLCVEAGGGTHVVGDVTDPGACRRIVDAAVEQLGGLDVVVYSAGGAVLGPIGDADARQWAADYAVNVIGATQITAAALPHLHPDGLVAFVSSETTSEPRWGMSSYIASKAALDASIRSWRLEHPERRFTRIVMGATMPTDFAVGFDHQILTTSLHRWRAAGISSTMMATDHVGRQLAGFLALLMTQPELDVPDITLAPRGDPLPATPQQADTHPR